MQIVYTEQHRLHATDQVQVEDYPFSTWEVPARAEAILACVQAAQIGPLVKPIDHGLAPILAVHDAGFLQFLQNAYTESAALTGSAGPVFTHTFATRYRGPVPQGFYALKGYYAFGWGSPILEGTWEAAYWAAQCALTAADLVREGERAAYALCRPPGHHAASDLYGGYCYLNNAAVAARALQAQSDRVAILDIDYHHGNGTQAIFYADPTVFFASLHAHPSDDYPYYWGYADELGDGPGLGYTRNWPLPLGTDDGAYLDALDRALEALIGFQPDWLVVSAGFDTVHGDPEGGFELTTEGLHKVGKRIAALGLRTVIVQEGGYRLDRLGEDAVGFLEPFSS